MNYDNLPRSELKKLAIYKARNQGFATTLINQRGNATTWKEWLSDDVWDKSFGEKKTFGRRKGEKSAVTTEPVKDSLPVMVVLPEAVKEPLPVPATAKPPKAHKGMIANGRSQKGIPSFDKWFCQIFPKDVTYPAWRYLTKTATDVANICRAKAGRAAACSQKDSSKVPVFDFTFSEAENFFGWTRPTFAKAIHLLLEIGFIEYSRPGGIVNGQGVKAQYRLSNKWQSWEPPKIDTTNIDKARSAKKQNPSKGALTSIGKGALTS
jgi:hypothetical protein